MLKYKGSKWCKDLKKNLIEQNKSNCLELPMEIIKLTVKTKSQCKYTKSHHTVCTMMIILHSPVLGVGGKSKCPRCWYSAILKLCKEYNTKLLMFGTYSITYRIKKNNTNYLISQKIFLTIQVSKYTVPSFSGQCYFILYFQSMFYWMSPTVEVTLPDPLLSVFQSTSAALEVSTTYALMSLNSIEIHWNIGDDTNIYTTLDLD